MKNNCLQMKIKQKMLLKFNKTWKIFLELENNLKTIKVKTTIQNKNYIVDLVDD